MAMRALLLSFTFFASAVLMAMTRAAEVAPAHVPLARLPMAIGPWRGQDQPPLDERELANLGADDYLARVYVDRQAVTGLFVGFWASQRQRDTVHSPLNCLPGSGWEKISTARLDVALDTSQNIAGPTPRHISVNRLIVQKGLERQLVLYWFQGHGRVVASEYASKFLLAADAVRLNRTDGALVRVMVRLAGESRAAEDDAERNGVGFVRTMFPLLTGLLPA
jgi:EpsI family protein